MLGKQRGMKSVRVITGKWRRNMVDILKVNHYVNWACVGVWEALEKGQCVQKCQVWYATQGAGSLEPRLLVRWRFLSLFIIFHFLPSLFDFLPPRIYHSNCNHTETLTLRHWAPGKSNQSVPNPFVSCHSGWDILVVCTQGITKADGVKNSSPPQITPSC